MQNAKCKSQSSTDGDIETSKITNIFVVNFLHSLKGLSLKKEEE